MEDMAKLLGGGGAAAPGGGTPDGVKGAEKSMARLGIAAQLYARESGCKCKGCVLLRQMVELMVGDLLTTVAEDAGSTDTPPG